jgi:hypothetical protein
MPNVQPQSFLFSQATGLSFPGAGATAARHRALFDWGLRDLSFARIVEAHADALAILAESKHVPRPRALYGVWASDALPSRVTCERLDDRSWTIDGIKQFCSGAALLDAALVTAHSPDGVLLFDLPLREGQVTVKPSLWRSPAFADTSTTGVEFNSLRVLDSHRLGDAGWYLHRPGFWQGAIGPAACWAGGAQSLIDAATKMNRRDPHSRAHVGALQAASWNLKAILDQAGQEIDADPHNRSGCARRHALMVRHLIERTCADVLDRFGRATGPHLLAFDEHVIAQHQALTLYIRQCHGERDLENIPQQTA